MPTVLSQQHDGILTLTLNRIDKHNAFDDHLISEIIELLEVAQSNDSIRAIILQSNGKNFSAGADLNWMKRMADYSQQQNYQDSLALAHLMQLLYDSPQPTIALVQGAAMGGGAGLVAACDIAIAADNASFCFSEVKLGLIPAVISPYVVNAIGARAAKRYFVSAERFNAERALNLGLVSQVCPLENLQQTGMQLAQSIAANAPDAVKQSKQLIQEVSNQPIDDKLIQHTAHKIAQKRVSREGQLGLKAFLTKQKPNWN